MLSNTGTYALRAVIFLAGKNGQGPVRVDDVADALDAPRNYLSKVLHALAQQGILASSRGPHGGFELAVSPSEVTLADVLEPFEQVEQERTCLLGEGKCDDADPCALHYRWKDVVSEVAGFFRETVLEDVVANEERRKLILGG